MKLTILAVGYRARCTEAGCANLGRLILRHADAGGRLMSNSEFCHAHARVKLSRDRAGGLRVYDAASLSEPIPRLAAPQPPVAATHETGARSSKTVKTSYQGSDARARGRCYREVVRRSEGITSQILSCAGWDRNQSRT
jgi:hypothetical protein